MSDVTIGSFGTTNLGIILVVCIMGVAAWLVYKPKQKLNILALALTAALLIFINGLPQAREVILSCYPGAEHHYQALDHYGFPFSYATLSHSGSDCYVANSETGKDEDMRDGQYFNQLHLGIGALVADLSAAGIILGTQTWLIRSYRKVRA